MRFWLKGKLVVPENVDGYYGNTTEIGMAGEHDDYYMEFCQINEGLDEDLMVYADSGLNFINPSDYYITNNAVVNKLIPLENVTLTSFSGSNISSLLGYGQGTKFILSNGAYIENSEMVKYNYQTSSPEVLDVTSWAIKIGFYKPNGNLVSDFTTNNFLSYNNYNKFMMTMAGATVSQSQARLNSNKSLCGQFIFIHPLYRDIITSAQDIADLLNVSDVNEVYKYSYVRKPPLMMGTALGVFNNSNDFLTDNMEVQNFALNYISDNTSRPDTLTCLGAVGQYLFTFSDGPTGVDNLRFYQAWYEFFNGADSTNDPNVVNPDDIPSGPGGGGGTWDDSSDISGGIDLPTLQGMDVGLISAYQMDSNNLTKLASSLWSNDIASALKNIFSDPISSVISLSILPIELTGTSIEITLGNVSTGVNGNKLSKRFYVIDCGNYTLSEYEGSYMDYNPHTKVSLYLPFIGIVGLNTNEVMGSTINIQYAIDVLTGQCIAVVTVSKGNLQSVIYNYEGSCIVNMPITSNNMGQMGKMVAGGIGSAGLGLITGNPLMMTAGMGSAFGGAIGSLAGLGNIQRSGDVSGSAGMMNCKIPYLIIERQIKAYPQNFLEYEGRTSMITYQLSQLSGFTQVSNIELEGITATEEELKEIESLLQGGVFL